jgi:uncharacterized protein (TIGR02246 family)
LEESFNRGDAKTLAANWTTAGDFVGPRSQRIVGREKIAAAFQDFLAAHKKSKMRLGVVDWRPVTDCVALVDLISEMTPPPEGFEGEARATVVLVKQDGNWLIDSFRETATNTATQHSHLKELAWLVGDWAQETSQSGVSVRSTCDWTVNSSFLIRKFTISGKKGTVLGGTDVIGWDPRNHRIRSWTFESDGGFSDGVWTRDGDSWSIEYNGILPDGSDVSATYVLTRVDADTLTFQAKDRSLNGQKQPDVEETTVKRQTVEQTKSKQPEKALKVLP